MASAHWRVALRGVVATMIAMVAAVPVSAQPAMSRGEESMPINRAECVRRAPLALRAEGYSAIDQGNEHGVMFFGFKEIHSVYILCSPAADGRMWVNVVVASNAVDGGVPGAQRVRLMNQMRRNDLGAGGPGNTGGGGSGGGGAAKPITWTTTANPAGLNLRGRNGQRFTLACPPNGSPGSVGGTDVYLDDSSICTAAVHQGLITFRDGGNVTIEIRPGQRGYQGSTRNGVTSGGFSADWYGSFVFVGQPATGDLPDAIWRFGKASSPAATAAELQKYAGTWYSGGGCEYTVNISVSGDTLTATGTFKGPFTDNVSYQGKWNGSGFSGTYRGSYSNPGCISCAAKSGTRIGTFTWRVDANGTEISSSVQESKDSAIWPGGRSFVGTWRKKGCQ